MPAPLEALPLEVCKRMLAVSHDGDDVLLTGLIESSVSWCSERLSQPIEAVTETYIYHAPPANCPVVIYGLLYVKSIESVQYWLKSDADLMEPRELAKGDLGRYDKAGLLYPPDAGWPDFSNPIRVTLIREIDKVKPALQAAIALGVQQLYHGFPKIDPNSAFDNLLNSLINHKYVGLAPPQL